MIKESPDPAAENRPMEIILKHGSPLLFDSAILAWAFLLLPGLLAALGARLCQGSFFRIVGGTIGGGLRDFAVLLAVNKGWIQVSNPNWEQLVSAILIFFCAAGGALGSCLAPYRGKQLMLNSAIGAFLGQFLLPFVLLKRRKAG